MAVQKKSAETKIDFMKAVNDINKPLAIAGGLALGTVVLKRLKKSQAVTGLLGPDLKSYVIPAGVTLGALIGTRLTDNKTIQWALLGVSAVGVGGIVYQVSGKSILKGLEGIIDGEEQGDTELLALDPITQALPAADIDIESEIETSVSGAEDFSMSDEPVGNAANDFSMSDEPIGTGGEDARQVGKIKSVDPDSMDYDIFSGDMMES